MHPKYHLFQQSSLGLNTGAPPSTGLSLKTETSSLDSPVCTAVTPHQCFPVNKTHTITPVFHLTLPFIKKQTNKKTLTLSTSQTRIINILLWTILATNRMNPKPNPTPSPRKLLYTLYTPIVPVQSLCILHHYQSRIHSFKIHTMFFPS